MAEQKDEQELIILDDEIRTGADAIKAVSKVVGTCFKEIAPIVKLWDEVQGSYKNKNIMLLLKWFEIECEGNRELIEGTKQRIDLVEQFIPTREETGALAVRVFEKMMAYQSEEKIRHFAAILANSPKQPKLDVEDKLTCVDFCDALSNRDIAVLGIVEANPRLDFDDYGKRYKIDVLGYVPEKAKGTILNKSFMLSGEEEGQIIVSLSKLESRGLIGETTGPTRGEVPLPSRNWRTEWKDRVFEILPFGTQLLLLLRKNSHAEGSKHEV